MNQKLHSYLLEKAKQHPKSVAFPEATNEKMLKAAFLAQQEGITKPILVGDPNAIRQSASKFDVDISEMELVDLADEDLLKSLAERYLQINDMFSEKSIRRKLNDPLNRAAVMVALGDADAMFAGIDYSTGDVIFAGQALVGLQEGIQTVSSVGIMDVPGFEGSEGSLIGFADCAVNAVPDAEMLSDIAITSCDTMKMLLGWDPKVAMLSFSTDGSAEHETVDKVRQAVKLANEKRPDLKIDGEFQFDAAIDPAVGKKKVNRESAVAGCANMVVFPDLAAGNIAVKIIQLMAHGDAIGPVLQGFAKPVADCSRSASVEELVDNIAILVIRA